MNNNYGERQTNSEWGTLNSDVQCSSAITASAFRMIMSNEDMSRGQMKGLLQNITPRFEGTMNTKNDRVPSLASNKEIMACNDGEEYESMTCSSMCDKARRRSTSFLRSGAQVSNSSNSSLKKRSSFEDFFRLNMRSRGQVKTLKRHAKEYKANLRSVCSNLSCKTNHSSNALTDENSVSSSIYTGDNPSSSVWGELCFSDDEEDHDPYDYTDDNSR